MVVASLLLLGLHFAAAAENLPNGDFDVRETLVFNPTHVPYGVLDCPFKEIFEFGKGIAYWNISILDGPALQMDKIYNGKQNDVLHFYVEYPESTARFRPKRLWTCVKEVVDVSASLLTTISRVIFEPHNEKRATCSFQNTSLPVKIKQSTQANKLTLKERELCKPHSQLTRPPKRTTKLPVTTTTTTTTTTTSTTTKAATTAPDVPRCLTDVPDTPGDRVPFTKYQKGKMPMTIKTCGPVEYNFTHALYGHIHCDMDGLDSLTFSFEDGRTKWEYSIDHQKHNVALKKFIEGTNLSSNFDAYMDSEKKAIVIVFEKNEIWGCDGYKGYSTMLLPLVRTIKVVPTKNKYAFCVWRYSEPMLPLNYSNTDFGPYDISTCKTAKPIRPKVIYNGPTKLGLYFDNYISRGNYRLAPFNGTINGQTFAYLPAVPRGTIQCNLQGFQDSLVKYGLHGDWPGEVMLSRDYRMPRKEAPFAREEIQTIYKRDPKYKSVIIDLNPGKYWYCSKESQHLTDRLLASAPQIFLAGGRCKFNLRADAPQRVYDYDLQDVAFAEKKACSLIPKRMDNMGGITLSVDTI